MLVRAHVIYCRPDQKMLRPSFCTADPHFLHLSIMLCAAIVLDRKLRYDRSMQKTIGIVGGGQLGRMLTLAAIPLGFKVVVVDPGQNCPAAQVGARQIVGALNDPAALKELGEAADFVTVEIEHVDTRLLEQIVRAGTPVNPAPETIALIQDKYAQKQFLEKAGIPVAPFVAVDDQASAEQALHDFGGKMLLKTRRGAYDGRGNMVVSDSTGIEAAFALFGDQPLYAEQFVPFKQELAIMVARALDGQTAAYPVVETVQERNICLAVLVPAEIPDLITEQAREVALQVAAQLDGAGVYGIELFLTEDNRIIVNEIAPRVHNSGHYTTEACRTSQFEQHIRAISGLPLGATELIAPAAVMVNILGERDGETDLHGVGDALAQPDTALHWYGKSPTKVDRKMGHITAIGSTPAEARMRAEQARKALNI